MSFILVSSAGEELCVNGWNWRPTLELLRAGGLLDVEQFEFLGLNCGGTVNAELTLRIAQLIEARVREMKPDERVRYDLSVTNSPRKPVVFSPEANPDSIDVNDLYSASYQWLIEFKDFCRNSNGFTVL